MLNPLLDATFRIITRERATQLHRLAAALDAEIGLPKLDNDPDKDLFKRNFLLMNALYQLQHEGAEQGYHLQVEAMDIRLTEQPAKSALQTQDPLRDYYLDWRNYDTSKDDVITLLDQFWQRYLKLPQLAPQQHAELIKKWQLPTPYCRRQLSKRWRTLAFAAHPDQQGNNSEFQQLQHEYEQLKHYAKVENSSNSHKTEKSSR
ncbi:DNA-J related domain-containing protein [Pseudoalteromonas rubra]|uniref:DNA-J related domain-containing protein n=1 Tax=Pseudoalteromonas rubra TaxID=43658 RepID=UPI002DB6D5FF|nr:DNA-J related domain-containing protein [Pseudoalteromonas rubra]MEC4091313.1 DNA-J related domain-containing protein [Pseudoalteromonas rubra]